MIEDIVVDKPTTPLVDHPDIERVRWMLSDRWIGFPRADAGLARMRGLLDHPRRTRMPGLLIYGDSGMGKTMLAEKLKRETPPWFDAESGIERHSVIVIQTPPSPDEKRLYLHILGAIGAPIRPYSTLGELEVKVIVLLRELGVRMLVMDEVHNMLAGSYREQRRFLNVLRFLSNELKLPLVCLGVAEARDAIRGDIQLARRFDEYHLATWSADPEFAALMKTIMQALPLRRPSALTAKALRHALSATGGVTSLIFRMFSELAISAINSGEESLSSEAVLNWRPGTFKVHFSTHEAWHSETARV